jgi:hypothetical protein
MRDTSNTNVLARHICALDPVCDLLECNLSSKIRAPMLRLNSNAEGTEAAVIRRADLIWRDILTGLD